MKRIYSLFITMMLVCFVGCSNEETAQNEPSADLSEPAVATEKKELLTLEDSLEYILNDPWKRAIYDDNSGFYDNEFSYLTDDVPLDDYITYGQITQEFPMDVTHIKVIEVQVFPGDSALVDVEVALVGKVDGKIQNMQQVITVYKTEGRWIKPTISVIRYQLEYEDKIRKAIEAAEEEE